MICNTVFLPGLYYHLTVNTSASTQTSASAFLTRLSASAGTAAGRDPVSTVQWADPVIEQLVACSSDRHCNLDISRQPQLIAQLLDC